MVTVMQDQKTKLWRDGNQVAEVSVARDSFLDYLANACSGVTSNELFPPLRFALRLRKSNRNVLHGRLTLSFHGIRLINFTRRGVVSEEEKPRRHQRRHQRRRGYGHDQYVSLLVCFDLTASYLAL